MSERPAVFWTCDDDTERLWCDTIEEALYAHADASFPDPMPEHIEVYGYARTTLPTLEELQERWYGPLPDLLERLDEEYGDPEGEGTTPTEAMREAERAFLTAVLAGYEPWTCERVEARMVRVADYLTDEVDAAP